jgi:hypothetical protein
MEEIMNTSQAKARIKLSEPCCPEGLKNTLRRMPLKKAVEHALNQGCHACVHAAEVPIDTWPQEGDSCKLSFCCYVNGRHAHELMWMEVLHKHPTEELYLGRLLCKPTITPHLVRGMILAFRREMVVQHMTSLHDCRSERVAYTKDGVELPVC